MRIMAVFRLVAALAASALGGVGCGGGDVAADAGDGGIDPDDGLSCDGGRLDVASELCWQHPQAPAYYAWQDAIYYCDALELAGSTDWVLPSRDDFIGLLGGCDGDVTGGENGFCSPCADGATCGELFGADGDWYWSSTAYDDGHAWLAHFDDGYLNRSDVGYAFYVRCVRPGP
jgi:hypothetical protein